MNIDVLTVFSPYIGEVFVTVATAVIAFVGKAAYGFITAHKNDKNFQFLTSIAEKAVQAAEQLYAEYDGDTKKQFALDFVQSWLDANHLKIDAKAVDAAIEAAVMTEFNFPAAVEPASPPAEAEVVSTPDADPDVSVATPVDGTGATDSI